MPFLVSASAVFFYLTVASDAPDLKSHAINLAMSLLPLAAGSLVIAYVEAVRIRAGAFGEILESTPVGKQTPHVAQSLALSGIGLLASSLVIGPGLVYLMAGNPVRDLDAIEVGVGVAAVLLAVSIGGLLGARVAIKGLVAIVILTLGLIQLGTNPDVGILGLEGTAAALKPLAPVQIPSQFVPLDLVDRNSSARLALVLGLSAITWGGAHLSRRHLWIPSAVALVGASLVVVNWQASLPEQPSGSELAAFYNSDRQCQTIDTVRACSYPGFESWAERWVAGISSGPLSRWHQVESIVQLSVGEDESSAAQMTWVPGVLRTGMSYDRGESSGPNTAALRLQAALGAVGLPETISDQNGGCFAGNQARAVVALWLAGWGTAEGPVASWLSRAQASKGETFWIGTEPAQVHITRADVDLALRMLTAQDRSGIEKSVESLRPNLHNGSLRSSDLAAVLGLPYVPTELTQSWGSPCA